MWLGLLFTLVIALSTASGERPNSQVAARIAASDKGDDLTLTWEGDEKVQVTVSKSRGLFQAPLRIQVNDRSVSLGGFYVHLNRQTNDFVVENTQAGLNGNGIQVMQVLRHPHLDSPTKLRFSLWMEPQDGGLCVRVAVEGRGQHLDRLGLGDHAGEGLAAQRMFFGRMYVLE